MWKKSIFLYFYIFIFLILVWQGTFWVGEYRHFKKYNKTMEKIDQEISFRDWATNYSFQKMLVVGNIVQFIKYQKYVAVNQSFGKPVILWDEWKKGTKEINEDIQDAIDLVESELSLEEADTYGGDTPEETWEMFLDALRDGDVELASKYFVPRKQAENLEWFQKVKEAGMLEEMVEDLSVSGLDMVFDSDTMKDYAVGTDEEVVKAYVRVRKNFNNKWSIESI